LAQLCAALSAGALLYIGGGVHLTPPPRHQEVTAKGRRRAAADKGGGAKPAPTLTLASWAKGAKPRAPPRTLIQ
jgi:hypothetical protein